MITLCASIVMGAQIMTRNHNSHVTYRDHGYWTANEHSIPSSFELLAPKVCAIVMAEQCEPEANVSDDMIQHINDHRSGDVSFAIIASVLVQWLFNAIT